MRCLPVVEDIYFNLGFTPGAAIDVERGREDLGKAEKFKKAALKKKFICLAIIIVAVLIILLSKLEIDTS